MSERPLLAAQAGQPWIQSYTPAVSTSPDYVLHDQQGTPLGFDHNGNVYFFVTDNQGSVVDLIGTSGSTSATYNWDPYGHLISQSGGEENYNPHPLHRRPGRHGAFTQPDPQTQLTNPQDASAYPYAADNPANYTDPTGQASWASLLFAFTSGVLGGLVCGFAVASITANPAIGAIGGAVCGAAISTAIVAVTS